MLRGPWTSWKGWLRLSNIAEQDGERQQLPAAPAKRGMTLRSYTKGGERAFAAQVTNGSIAQVVDMTFRRATPRLTGVAGPEWALVTGI